MFSIPFCQSIGIHVVLVIVFGITELALPGNGTPVTETCANVRGEIICYFKGSEKFLPWNEAWLLCNSLNSTMPVIRNRNDQDVLEGYLKSHNIINSAAWTAGRNVSLSTWTWINGESPKESDQVELQRKGRQTGEVYAALRKDFTLTTGAPHNELPYICEHEGTYCNSVSDMIVNDKCFRLINDRRTWYDARNQCLMTNGDLAVIGDEDQRFLRMLTLDRTHWIGLRKKSWRWFRTDNAKSKDDIKFTNWDVNIFSRSGECISIDASDGNWKAVGCKQPKEVVCQRAARDESTTYGSQGSTLKSSAVSKKRTTYRSQGSTLNSSAVSEVRTAYMYGSQVTMPKSSAVSEERTTYGSQGSMSEKSVFSDEITTYGSQGSIPKSSVVYEEITTYGSQGFMPERSAFSDETTTLGSQGSKPESSVVSEESTTYGSQGSIPKDLPGLDGSPSSILTTSLLLAVVVPAIIIIICITCIIVVVLLRSRNRTGNYNFRIIGDSQFNSRTSLNHGEELDTVTTNAPVDTPVNEPADVPVKRSDDFPAIYEEIPLTTSQPSEDEATNQPGITCASLEWQNEPIYLEPREQCAQTTSPTKIGPLGDIYAMPHAKGYDVTLPGNASAGSDAHPIKATAREVVYARPMKTSKSSAASHPSEVIYGNLEGEVLGTEQTADNHDQTKKVRFTDDV